MNSRLCPNCGQYGIPVSRGDHWEGTKNVRCIKCKCPYDVSFEFVGYAPGHEEASGYQTNIVKARARKKRAKKKK